MSMNGHRGDGPDTHKVTKKEEEIELVQGLANASSQHGWSE